QDGMVGFINTKGKVVVPAKFKKVFNFENGYAKVLEDDKWGLIDPSGSYFVKPEYDGISNFYDGHVVANMGDKHGLIINKKFKEVPGAEKIWDFSRGSKYTYAKKDGKMGFINGQGEWIIEPTYEKARAFVNGLAPVMKDKNWGYINIKGEEVIPFEYRDAEIFSEDGLAPVKLTKLWGFINKEGKLVIEDTYDITAGGFSIFQKNNPKGFYNGLARVKNKKSWVYINTQGKVLKDLQFENLELFN
ncbi:MAG: WG repeat-containing protein, partial [Xanthomarina sp.]